MKRLTVDDSFERWWAKYRPSSWIIEKHGMQPTHIEIVRDWARVAFNQGYGFGQRREAAKHRKAS